MPKPVPAPARTSSAAAGGRVPRGACTIEWRPDYVRSKFVAVLAGVNGPRGLVAASEPFNWPPTRPPEPTDAARAAHDALVERLVAAGWESVDADTDEWYAQTFAPTGQAGTNGDDGAQRRADA